MIRHRRLPSTAHPVGIGLAIVLIAAAAVATVVQGRRERALLDGGYCTKVTEVLYTPPPSAHTHCYGDGPAQSCHTSYTQADPYMRSLWRCSDPERDGRTVEFWRRTAEEYR